MSAHQGGKHWLERVRLRDWSSCVCFPSWCRIYPQSAAEPAPIGFLSQLQTRSQNVYSLLVWLVLPLLGLLCLSLMPWSPLGVKQSKPSPACNTPITGNFLILLAEVGLQFSWAFPQLFLKKPTCAPGTATSGCAWTERCLSLCSWLG